MSRTEDLIMSRATLAAAVAAADDKDGIHGSYQSFGLTKRLDVRHSDSAFRSASQGQVNPMLGDQIVLTCA